jgi:hypothetical protein
MSARLLLAAALAAAAGFAASRALLDSEATAAPLPEPLARALAWLLEARDRTAEAIAEARAAREQAASELTQDYLQRIHRQPPA